MSAGIPIAVTPKLAAELAAASRNIAGAEDMNNRGKLSDSGSYATLVDQLEKLTVTVLGAVSTAPLTGPQLIGARFVLGAGTPLNTHVIECAAYLRDTAAELLLDSRQLERFKATNCCEVLDMLKRLNGMIMSAIVKQAQADLDAVRSRGINSLMPAAAALAKAAAPVSKDQADSEA